MFVNQASVGLENTSVVEVDGLHLNVGVRYFCLVTACNNAGGCTTGVSDGVTVGTLRCPLGVQSPLAVLTPQAHVQVTGAVILR